MSPYDLAQDEDLLNTFLRQIEEDKLKVISEGNFSTMRKVQNNIRIMINQIIIVPLISNSPSAGSQG